MSGKDAQSRPVAEGQHGLGRPAIGADEAAAMAAGAGGARFEGFLAQRGPSVARRVSIKAVASAVR
jgi:hypothetical protein